jgi:hypothetical protein
MAKKPMVYATFGTTAKQCLYSHTNSYSNTPNTSKAQSSYQQCSPRMEKQTSKLYITQDRAREMSTPRRKDLDSASYRKNRETFLTRMGWRVPLVQTRSSNNHRPRNRTRPRSRPNRPKQLGWSLPQMQQPTRSRIPSQKTQRNRPSPNKSTKHNKQEQFF